MIESVMLTHNPTWADCQQLMLTMFTTEERARINSSARKILLAQAVEDAKPQPEVWAEEHYPKTDPKWPYNTAAGIAHLQTYRTAVIMGVKAGGKKPTNMGKIADIVQESKESPSAFLERLLDAYRMYSPIDPEAVENQRLINSSFVGQSQRDIRNKIQRLDGFLGKGISELVEIANKVFHLPPPPSLSFASFETHCIRLFSPLALRVAVIYRPPGPTSQFFDHFATWLSHFLSSNLPCLILGDFNIPIDDPSAPAASKLLSLTSSLGLTQSSLPTAMVTLLTFSFPTSAPFLSSTVALSPSLFQPIWTS
uniref:Core shell protein Gag P30 domain-containing protein n=1 Tax=Leptobrachium leishanense TaxID=445787 RepID=A0A8C5R7J5_9ANUR